jgi:hypothetical protein
MNIFSTAMAGALVAIAAVSAGAAEFPKSGSSKSTGYAVSTSLEALEGWDAEWQPNINVMTSINRTEGADGALDKSYMRCIGQEAMVAGIYRGGGSCTETDSDGDKIFISWESDAFTLIGGTGKYKGITGGGTSKYEPVYQDKKNWAGMFSFEKHWEIK